MSRLGQAEAPRGLKVAVLGGGWAGMAAAVRATQLGHRVTVYEAARVLGGRARAFEAVQHDGNSVNLDNGQHILIGAYRDTLRLMRQVGVSLPDALHALPLAMQNAEGQGLRLAALPKLVQRLFPGADVVQGILRAQGWTWQDRWRLMQHAVRWRLSGFQCQPETSVAHLCRHLTPRVIRQLIDPLCVSALNTPASRASGQVFLRVLRDALFSAQPASLPYPGSTLLLPRQDLSRMFPNAAAKWLRARGMRVELGRRVQVIEPLSDLTPGPENPVSWDVLGERHDRIIIACQPSEAARLVRHSSFGVLPRARNWLGKAMRLQFEAIATVYLQATPDTQLQLPMLALTSGPEAPAQFVFDRGQLGGPPGLLAFVVSASSEERTVLAAQVQSQALNQLGLKHTTIVQTVIEKRATFACTPKLQRPAMRIGDGLLACGDYIDGPYPATLEGAVRSGIAAAEALL
ncbi:MAG: hypothetical protein RLZZ401_660 [Pseudomonadota bacterium]